MRDAATIELGEVQETLLIPLYMRALESRRSDAICHDPKAEQLVRQLDYDFSRFDDESASMQLDIAVRTEILDEVVCDFLSRHPASLVVNLGAGLDGRFLRLDNGQVTWMELDLPDVIALRRKYYRETLRNPFIARSVTDFSWLSSLDRRPQQAVLVIAEGLLPYLMPRDVESVFRKIGDVLPGAEVAFQSISPGLVNQQHLVPAVKRTSAAFHWGVRSGREVTELDPRYEFVSEWAYIDRHPRRWEPILRRWWYVPDLRRQMGEIMKITHLRVRGEAVSSAADEL